MDAFQGHYKDGTNETRDYRAMASLQFIVRAVLVYNDRQYGIRPNRLVHVQGNIILLMCLSTCYLVIQPYRKKYMNVIEGILYTFTAIMIVSLGSLKFNQDGLYCAEMYLKLVLILLPSLLYCKKIGEDGISVQKFK